MTSPLYLLLRFPLVLIGLFFCAGGFVQIALPELANSDIEVRPARSLEVFVGLVFNAYGLLLMIPPSSLQRLRMVYWILMVATLALFVVGLRASVQRGIGVSNVLVTLLLWTPAAVAVAMVRAEEKRVRADAAQSAGG